MKRAIIIAIIAFGLAAAIALWLVTREPTGAVASAPAFAPAGDEGGLPPSSPRSPVPATPGSASAPAAPLVQARDGRATPDGPREVRLTGNPSAPSAPAAPADPEPPHGTLDKDDIRNAITAITPLVRDCYEQGLKQNPDLSGRMELHFTIIGKDNRGRIEDARVGEESSLANLFVQACVLGALGKADFKVPHGDGAVDVTYPFIFAANDAQRRKLEAEPGPLRAADEQLRKAHLMK